MSNQKLNYRKILTSERLPDKYAFYIVKQKNEDIPQIEYFYENSLKKGWITNFDWWLEEIPNREEELADLLEEALNLLDDFPYEQSLQERRANLTMNAQNLIWEIKNNAPKLLDDE